MWRIKLNIGLKVGKAALDNPDLPIEFIRDLLISHAQDRSLSEPFIPEGKDDEN